MCAHGTAGTGGGMGGWPHYTDSLVDSLIVSIYSVDADADDLDTETLNLVGSLTTVFTRDSGASCASVDG